jgi:crotonobetaine/carnitine-CoA ligase
MGAITVPINTALRGRQLSHIVRNSTPKLPVIESSLLAAIETLEYGVSALTLLALTLIVLSLK